MTAWSPAIGFALARLCRGIESAQFNFGFADGWHEGTADATLLTLLRGWASALLPGSHTTHIVRLVAHASLPHKFFSCRHSPRAGTLRHGIYVRQCGVVCNPAAALSRGLLSRPSRSVGASRAPTCRHPVTPAVRAAVLQVSAGKICARKDFESSHRHAAFTASSNFAFASFGLTNQSVDQIR